MSDFLNFIASPNVTTILLIFALVGLVVEIFTPGFGLGGVVSLIAFSLFFISNMAAQDSNWYAILIFLIGIGLIFVEVLIPGFGIAGISGIVAIIAGIIIAMNSIEVALKSLSVAIVISAVIITFIIKRSKNSKFIKNSLLLNSHKSEKGYLSVDNSTLKKGDIAVTTSVLKPTGFIEFNGEKFEAISEDGFIEKGSKVEVSKTEGFKNFVRRIEK